MAVTRCVKSRIRLDITGMELGITSNLNSISSFFEVGQGPGLATFVGLDVTTCHALGIRNQNLG